MGVEQFGKGNVWASAKEAGIWKDIPFKASNFNAGLSTWNITAADVTVNKYTRIGNTIIWNININNVSTLVGASVNYVNLNLPIKCLGGSYTAFAAGRTQNSGSNTAVVGVNTIGENVATYSPAHARVSIAPFIPIVAGLLYINFILIYEAL